MHCLFAYVAHLHKSRFLINVQIRLTLTHKINRNTNNKQNIRRRFPVWVDRWMKLVHREMSLGAQNMYGYYCLGFLYMFELWLEIWSWVWLLYTQFIIHPSLTPSFKSKNGFADFNTKEAKKSLVWFSIHHYLQLQSLYMLSLSFLPGPRHAVVFSVSGSDT